MALRQRRRVHRPPLTHHSFRESHTDPIKPLTDLGQHFPPTRQRLTQQATARMIKQIEHHVPHWTPVPRLPNPPRIGQPMPAQQPRQIGPAVGVEGH
jgi:hypothetical protein